MAKKNTKKRKKKVGFFESASIFLNAYKSGVTGFEGLMGNSYSRNQKKRGVVKQAIGRKMGLGDINKVGGLTNAVLAPTSMMGMILINSKYKKYYLMYRTAKTVAKPITRYITKPLLKLTGRCIKGAGGLVVSSSKKATIMASTQVAKAKSQSNNGGLPSSRKDYYEAIRNPQKTEDKPQDENEDVKNEDVEYNGEDTINKDYDGKGSDINEDSNQENDELSEIDKNLEKYSSRKDFMENAELDGNTSSKDIDFQHIARRPNQEDVDAKLTDLRAKIKAKKEFERKVDSINSLGYYEDGGKKIAFSDLGIGSITTAEDKELLKTRIQSLKEKGYYEQDGEIITQSDIEEEKGTENKVGKPNTSKSLSVMLAELSEKVKSEDAKKSSTLINKLTERLDTKGEEIKDAVEEKVANKQDTESNEDDNLTPFQKEKKANQNVTVDGKEYNVNTVDEREMVMLMRRGYKKFSVDGVAWFEKVYTDEEAEEIERARKKG